MRTCLKFWLGPDTTLQFVCGGQRVRCGQSGEGGEPVGMGTDDLAEPVKGVVCQLYGSNGIEPLGRRSTLGQHLHVNGGCACFLKLL